MFTLAEGVEDEGEVGESEEAGVELLWWVAMLQKRLSWRKSSLIWLWLPQSPRS